MASLMHQHLMLITSDKVCAEWAHAECLQTSPSTSKYRFVYDCTYKIHLIVSSVNDINVKCHMLPDTAGNVGNIEYQRTAGREATA